MMNKSTSQAGLIAKSFIVIFFLFVSFTAGYTVLTESSINLKTVFIGGFGTLCFIISMLVIYLGFIANSAKSKSS